MRGTEILRLVWLNIYQNKFKTVMTSIGIVVGAATIVMVIAIGRGGRLDVAEQFSSLNAGAIDVSYDREREEAAAGGGFSFGAVGEFFSNAFGGGMLRGGENGNAGGRGSGGEAGLGGGFPGGAGGDAGNGGADGAEEGFRGGIPGGAGGDAGNEGANGAERGSDDGIPGGAGGDAGNGGADGAEEGSGDGFPEGAGGNTGNGGTDGSEGGSGDDFTGAVDEAAGESSADSDDLESEGAAAEMISGEEESEAGESIVDDRMNQENIVLSERDVEDIEVFVTGISGVTISYTTSATAEGGNLSEGQMYTVAGAKNSYAAVSKLSMAAGEFLTDEDDAQKAKVCVLGSNAAKAIFGSAEEAVGESLYLDDRAYTVSGVLETTSAVSAGISPDETIFIPYHTGIKYITGENISPTITVLTDDVDAIGEVKNQVAIVLEENYSNAEFTFSDAGSKMEAAETSNRVLTMLLSAMAAIVFLVGGIGIMNVLFVSVKERTNEIGILKALGASKAMILSEFLVESAAISLIGGIIGVAVSFAVTPLVEHCDIRVEADLTAWVLALGFAVLTGTIFGIYPAWKASRLVPVDALNAE